jgi:non-heme chloroperoxidase
MRVSPERQCCIPSRSCCSKCVFSTTAGDSVTVSEGWGRHEFMDRLGSIREALQAQLAANRSEFYRAVPSGPFYNFDQPGVEPSEAVIANWWRQGMMGGAKGQYDCVSEFIREDYTDDLKKISVPVLVMNGEADQIVPYATSGPRAVKLVQNGTLKTYAGYPHGIPTTHADVINADLLAFIQS